MPNALRDAVATACTVTPPFSWRRWWRRRSKKKEEKEKRPVYVSAGSSSFPACASCTLDDSIPQIKLEKMLDELQQLRFCRQASSTEHVVETDLLKEIARLRALINCRHADPYQPEFSGRDDNRSAHDRRQEVARSFVPERMTSDAAAVLLKEEEEEEKKKDENA